MLSLVDNSSEEKETSFCADKAVHSITDRKAKILFMYIYNDATKIDISQFTIRNSTFVFTSKAPLT